MSRCPDPGFLQPFPQQGLAVAMLQQKASRPTLKSLRECQQGKQKAQAPTCTQRALHANLFIHPSHLCAHIKVRHWALVGCDDPHVAELKWTCQVERDAAVCDVADGGKLSL